MAMLVFQVVGILCTMLPNSIAFVVRAITFVRHKLHPPADDRFAAAVTQLMSTVGGMGRRCGCMLGYVQAS